MTPAITIPGYLRRSIVEEGGVRRTLFVASTAVPDRYDDIVDQATWRLENYRANPVVMADHWYTCAAVVGNGEVSTASGALALEITRWSKKAFAKDVQQDVDDGIISAVSVGFRAGRSIPRSQLPAEDPRFGQRGLVYYDCELLEVSIVPIPANPEALAAKGIQPGRVDVDDLVGRILDRLAQEPTQRDALAEVLRAPSPTLPAATGRGPLSHLFQG